MVKNPCLSAELDLIVSMISDINNEISQSSQPKKHRKITINDVNEIARLAATRKLTEKECCLMLDIKYDTWINWKSKNKNNSAFNDSFVRIRANKIDGLVNRIESAADDDEIRIGDKVITKRGDWRAGAWLAERIAPDRFYINGTNSAQSPQITVNIGIMHDTLKRVIGKTSDSNDSDNRDTIGFKQSLLPDSEKMQNDIKTPQIERQPLKNAIKLPIRKSD